MLPVFCFFTFTHLFCLPAFLLALLAGSGGVAGLAEGGGAWQDADFGRSSDSWH